LITKMASDRVPDNLKQRLKESYDSIATKYNAWTIPNSEQRLEYLEKLLAHLDKENQSHTGVHQSPKVAVLELGCGCGVPVSQKLLSRPNFHVTANDLSSTQIALARENLLPLLQPDGPASRRLTLLEGDMTALGFPAGAFDAVVAMYSLIHLPRAEQAALLGQMARWLRSGGVLLANFGGEATEGKVFERWLGQERGWVYWSGFGVDGTLAQVREAGFEVLVGDVKKDKVDATFLWVLAQKPVEL
jgi:SAM-dependent methyltransferase